MQNTITTEKIARRGVVVPTHYEIDTLAQIPVDRIASKPAMTRSPKASIASARALLAQYPYRSFPLTDAAGKLVACVLAAEIMGVEDSAKPLEAIAHSVTGIARNASTRDAWRDCAVIRLLSFGSR